jgi:hypothetical protein
MGCRDFLSSEMGSKGKNSLSYRLVSMMMPKVWGDNIM